VNERAGLYLSLVLNLLGKMRNLFTLDNCDVNELKASKLRKDYDAVTRSLLPRALAEFYNNYGFEAREEPDHLVTMLAFMAQLARDESQESLKAQLRFLNSHLIPTVKYGVEACPSLKALLEILEADAEEVKKRLHV